MNRDGSNQRNLTNHPACELESTWSPYGAQIAFATDRDGKSQIYVMDPDGSGQRRLHVFAQRTTTILHGRRTGGGLPSSRTATVTRRYT